MIPTYPIDCVQSAALPWWEQDDGKNLCRGRLIQSFLPHVHQIPSVLIPKGRSSSTEHTLADCEISPMSVDSPPSQTDLPLAGMRLHMGELFSVYKSKKRPALVLAMPGDQVPKKLFEGKPGYQHSPTILVAPYYTGGAAKFPPEFLVRARRCEYRQYVWDNLPLPDGRESILRMDHVQPLGFHYKAFIITQFRLCEDAVALMDEWMAWAATGELDEACGQTLPDLRRSLLALPSS